MKFDGFELSFESLPRRRNTSRRAAHPHLDHREPDESQLIAPARRCTRPSLRCRIARVGDTLYASNAGSGTPTRIGSVTVPVAVGGESIVAG
jgi:hypothetical protein